MSDVPPFDASRMRLYEALARNLFELIDTFADGRFDRREIGCALFIFGFGTGELTYVSNANREDMIKMLMEFIAHNPPQMKWDEQHG